MNLSLCYIKSSSLLNNIMDKQKEVIYLDDEKRSKCVKKLNEVIDNMDISKKVENSIYSYSRIKADNKSIDEREECFKTNYLNKSRSLYSNLNSKSYINNINLKDRFEKKILDPENAAYYTPKELFPEKWEKLLDAKNAINNFLYKKEPMIVTEQFTCGRCKKNKCTYYFLQVRSCDEPSTMFVTCLNCYHRW